MGNTYIVDITDYLLPGGDLPDGPAGRFARYFGRIVSAASLERFGIWVDTEIQCRRRPGRKPCPGHIRLRRIDTEDRVEWHCTSCDDNGWISRWQGTQWDLSVRESKIIPAKR